jgi:protein TonB
VSFVVNTDGRAEMSTFRVIRFTQAGFVEAVKTAVEHARFNPAEVGGKAVKQLVQLPFAFNLR